MDTPKTETNNVVPLRKVHTITSEERLYRFLLPLLDRVEPMETHNAGVIKCMREFCRERPNWSEKCSFIEDTFYLMDFMDSVRENTTTATCSEALTEFFFELWALASQPEKPTIAYCELLISYVELDDLFFVESKAGERILKGTPELTRRFGVRLALRKQRSEQASREEEDNRADDPDDDRQESGRQFIYVLPRPADRHVLKLRKWLRSQRCRPTEFPCPPALFVTSLGACPINRPGDGSLAQIAGPTDIRVRDLVRGRRGAGHRRVPCSA
jgi:hypothetical protein